MQTNWFKSGSWNCICDVCGFKFKSDAIRKRWDGLMVCDKDYETDHPQKHIRIRETGIAVPFIREPNDVFLEDIPPPGLCTIATSSGYAGKGTAGCMQAGNISHPYELVAEWVPF